MKNEKIKNEIKNIEKIITKTHPEEPIVYDGIINTNQFDGIVYLMKETTFTGYKKYKKHFSETYPNEFPEENFWDFIATTTRIINEPLTRIEKVWPVLSYWTEAIYSNKSFKECAEVYEKDCKNVDYSILHKVALVNIKKTAGASISDDKILKSATVAYPYLIKDELNIIEPKIVMCCGTFGYAKDLYNIKNCETLDCGAEYFKHTIAGNEVTFIEFMHPSCRVKVSATFAYMKALFSELKFK